MGQQGKQGSCIFASKGRSSKRYQQNVSRYSGQISSRIDDVPPARMLARGGNPEAKSNLEKDLKEIHANMNSMRPQIEDAEMKKVSLEKEGQQANERLGKAKNTKELFSKYKQKLANAKAKLRDAEQDMASDDRSQKKELLQKIMKQISGSVAALESHASSHDKLMESTFSSAGARIDKESVSYLCRKTS